MALHSKQVTAVLSPPVEVYPVDADGVELVISAGDEIYLGSSDVSANTGFRLVKGDCISLSLGPNERLYCMTTKGSITVYVLATKNG